MLLRNKWNQQRGSFHLGKPMHGYVFPELKYREIDIFSRESSISPFLTRDPSLLFRYYINIDLTIVPLQSHLNSIQATSPTPIVPVIFYLLRTKDTIYIVHQPKIKQNKLNPWGFIHVVVGTVGTDTIVARGERRFRSWLVRRIGRVVEQLRASLRRRWIMATTGRSIIRRAYNILRKSNTSDSRLARQKAPLAKRKSP